MCDLSGTQGVVFTKVETIATQRNLIETIYARLPARNGRLPIEYAGDFIPGPNYERYLSLISREVKISPAMLAITKTYCDRRANLDAAEIKTQVQFWQDEGRLDKRCRSSRPLLIGEETVSP
jgi:hypothetical protein